MQVRRVGGSGLDVSVLGLGTLGWGSRVDEYTALDLLKAFHDLGGTLVDTSLAYGAGQAAPLLGQVIATSRVRDRFVLAARAGVSVVGDRRVVDVSRSGLIGQLDDTLATLGVNHLDLWQLDCWDASVPLDETLSALALAVTSGKVRHVGVGNLPAWQTIALASGFDRFGTGVALVSSQSEYSLVNRACESDLLAALAHRHMGVLACSPLGRGVLTAKYRTGIPADSMAADAQWESYVAGHRALGDRGIVDAVARAADGLGVSPVAVALGWLWKRPRVASAVVGARTVLQIQQAAEALAVEVPDPIVSALDDVSQEV